MQTDASRIMKRYEGNPVIDPKDYPGVFQIFNPGVAEYQGKIILLASMVYFKGGGCANGVTKVAESEDGIHFKIRDEVFIDLQTRGFPYDIVSRHVIDNRVSQIGDTYYILTPVGLHGWSGPATVLGKTKDFKTYEPMEVVAEPHSRGNSLFPEKIKGKYYRLDRPAYGAGGEIWLSSSPDLIHWGCFRPVLRPSYAYWNTSKIGPTPPIKTDQGWLEIVHGVVSPCGGTYYSIGAVMLDLEEPWKVIGKTMGYLLRPEEDYETHGVVDNVVFPCGALADKKKDLLTLYYGAADTRICLATGKLSEVIEACMKES